MTTTHSETSITRRTAVGAGWMVAWRMVTRGLGMASTLILARLLAPADFGLVAIAGAFAAAIDQLSELGLRAALVRHADTDRALYDTAFTIQAMRGVVTGCVITGGAWGAGLWFGDARLMPLLLILAATAAVAGLDNIAVVQFHRDLRFDVEFRLLFVSRVLQFVAATAAAFILRSYWALIVGVVVARLSRTVMTYVVQPYRPRLGLSRWRDLVGFSFWSWAVSMAALAWERCDAFVLGPVLGAGPLGVFLLSAEIGLLPATEMVAPAAQALYPGVAGARNRGTDPIGLALPVMAALLMVVVPVGLGISATSGYVVAGLLGPRWAVGRPVIAIMALVCVLTPLTYVANTVLIAAGHVRQTFWAMAGAAVLRVGVLYAVAGTERLDWIAMAICGAIGGETLLLMTQLSRRGRLAWREALPGIARTAASCAAVAGLLWITGLGWHPVAAPWLAALLTGGAIGLGGIVGCLALQLALWRLAGRPAGPEATLLGLIGGATAGLRRRLARRRTGLA